MTKEQIFEKLFKYCQEHVCLGRRYIDYNFDKDENSTDGDAEVKEKDYARFMATVTFKKSILDDFSYNTIWGTSKLIIHELCHIYTGYGSKHFWSQHEFIFDIMGKNACIDLYNGMIFGEEQMTQMLDRIFLETFLKTKEYKEIKKLLK